MNVAVIYFVRIMYKNVQLLCIAVNMQLHFGLQNVGRGTHNGYLNSITSIEKI